MFVKQNEAEEPTFSKILHGLQLLMDSLLAFDVKSYRCPLGVVFASNENNKINFIKYADNNVENYKKIKNLLSQSFDEIKKQYLREDGLDFGEFFTKCKLIFDEVKTEMYKKIILFVTDEDDPRISDQLKFKALKVARAFNEQNLFLNLITFNSQFSPDYFYKDLLYEAGIGCIKDYLKDALSFCDFVESKIISKSVTFNQKFYYLIGDKETHLDLKIHNCVKVARFKKNMLVTKDTFEEVKKVSLFQLRQEEKIKVLYNKDSFVQVDSKVAENLKHTNFPSGYILLYVNSRETTKGFVIAKPVLLESKERDNIIYDTFWQYCYDNNVVLVCAQKFRSTSPIVFVELIPKIFNGVKMFLSVRVPTSDHFHFLSQENNLSNIKPRGDCMAVMRKIVDDMTFKFHPSLFPRVDYERTVAYVKSELTGEPMKTIESLEKLSLFPEGIECDFDFKAAEKMGVKRTNEEDKKDCNLSGFVLQVARKG